MTALQPATIALLAIDDDEDDLAILRHHLGAMTGLAVEISAHRSPDEGLLALSRRRFDAVLLDYQLGATTGLEFFRQIRDLGHDLPVILLTDQGDEELAVSCLHAGMSDYLPKAVASAKCLRRSITNAIEKTFLHRELARKQADLECAVRELRARTVEIQSFYHTLSHELKTPLTAVREFVSIVVDGLQGPLGDEQRRSLDRALACCDQMVLLMNDILDATRLETGKLAIHPRDASLTAVIDQAAAHCAPRAAKAGVVLKVEKEEGVDQAHCDPTRILQVLTNLLDNGIKYSETGGVVCVRLDRKPDDPAAARISVQDQGRGIAPEQQERVFDRLYQASEDDATIRGGLGIGLYLCRELLRLHGEKIELASAPGRGSTFTFSLRMDRGEIPSVPSSTRGAA